MGEASDDDDEDEEDVEEEEEVKAYAPPSEIPDSGLTAGEVVETVLAALNHNDVPDANRGVKTLVGFSGPSSVLRSPDKAPTVDEYADFLKTSEYEILLDHDGDRVVVDKADYAFDRKKAFYTVRLTSTGNPRDVTFVNFILSTRGSEEDDCWLVDSIIIRSRGIRRRGRR